MHACRSTLEDPTGAAFNATGNASDNVLRGNAAANVLTGLGGNDTLDGGAGGDTMAGGAGEDTYRVDSVGDVIVEASGEGADTIQSAVSYVLGANLENLTLTGTATIGGGNASDNVIVGNTAANALTGGAGNDTLDGGGGPDAMAGGLGDDVYVIDNTADVAAESANEGSDTVHAFITYALGVNLENLTLSGSGAVNGTGNAANNTIRGNSANNVVSGGAGNDTLYSSAGADTLAGGLGDDTYIVDHAGQTTVELANEGIDTVRTSFSYTLGANVENVILTAGGDASGNALNNMMTGSAGMNRLDGGAGADTMIGGGDDDTYYVDDAFDVVVERTEPGFDRVYSTVTYTLPVNVEILTLTGGPAINGTGNAHNNELYGNSGANVLAGGAGNDVLDGGQGADTLIGGAGNDRYSIDNAADVAIENAAEGTDWVFATVSYTLPANVENLAVTMASPGVRAAGNGLANYILGSGAGDFIDGGAGADTMEGGSGDDAYIVDSPSDLVVEYSGEGRDTVQSSITYALASEVEQLMLTGASAVNGTGNDGGNLMVGNSANNVLNGGGWYGNDTLDGGAGADTLIGGWGDDTYVLDNPGDAIVELANEGIDTVTSAFTYTLGSTLENLTLGGASAINGTGNAADNVLVGNAAPNVLAGGDGNDTISGGGGIDTLVGGLGDDRYDVDNGADSIVEAAGAGIDWVTSSATYTLAANIEKLTLTGSGGISGTGNDLANLLFGNGAANSLSGGAGNDTIDGGGGADNLIGGVGDDTYYVDNVGDRVSEAAGGGYDTVYSSASHTAGANVELLVLTGAAAIDGAGHDGGETINGSDGDNILRGLGGSDTMLGGKGYDVLDGGAGDDLVRDEAGNNILLGGAGADTLVARNGSNVIIGGAGQDQMTMSAGRQVVAFNRGDGRDVVYTASGDNTLSLGGGIRYSDMRLTRKGADLVLDLGGEESITFQEWYGVPGWFSYKSVLDLQVIAEAMADFNAASTDPLRNKKVTTFDFRGLANALDAQPGVTSIAMTDALLKTFLVSRSDDAALGADIAYRYGKTGSLAGMGFDPVVAMLSNGSFGASAQALQAATAVDTGSRRLM